LKKRVLPALVAVNLSLLVFVAVSGDLSDRSWVTSLVSKLPVFIFLLPTLGLALLSILARQIWVGGFHLAGFVAAFLVFVPYGAPKVTVPFFAADAKMRTVRVMTYNVDHGEGDGRAAVEAIRREKPDVFCLQAVDTKIVDAPLQVALRESLPGYDVRIAGATAIGSRLRVMEYRTRELPEAPDNRPIQELVVDWDGYPVRVVNVQMNDVPAEEYFGSDFATAKRLAERNSAELANQTQAILDLVPGPPPIVCGDFAQPPRGANYRKLRKVMLDAFIESGEGFGLTTPSAFPMDRPDFIFLAYGWRAERCWIPRTTASDHLPLVADVYPFVPSE
jgi:endonuclease/exonuclease/phosphatase family metal-dependent hydrolase